MNAPLVTPVARAAEMVPELATRAAGHEAARRVGAETAAALADAGFFRLLVPESLGGLEASPMTMVEVLATLAEGDAAAAWCVMTGTTTSLLGAYLPDEGAREVWADAATVTAGVFAPMGRAIPADGGYRLTGRWPFASGVDNATWRMGGALVMTDEGPRKLDDGSPEIRSMFFRAGESSVIDTWDTAGLCGTGSHDLEVKDLFVPDERTCCVLADTPRHDGPLYRFPVFGLLAAGVSAVALGIARAACTAMTDLARNKRGFGGKRTLAGSDLIQVEVARAEGERRAGEALLMAACQSAWEKAQAGTLDLDGRASLRLAATHAVQCAVRAVDAMYTAGGGTALYRTSSLQRHLRDVHTVTQHIMVAPQTMKTVGRVLLDVDTDVRQL